MACPPFVVSGAMRVGLTFPQIATQPRYAPGLKTSNVLPLPTCDDTLITPRCWRTTASTMARPMPEPWARRLVVKKGSNIFPRISGSMPGPVSETSREEYSPSGRRRLRRWAGWSPVACVARVCWFGAGELGVGGGGMACPCEVVGFVAFDR